MNFSDVEKLQFAEPYWLLLLLLIPILLWFQSLKSNKSPSIRFSSLQNILNIRLTGKGRYLWIPSLLRFLTIISLIITIARPQLDQSTEFIQSSGVDIVLAIDGSNRSMSLLGNLYFGKTSCFL